MLLDGFFGEDVEIDASDAGDGAGEVALDQVFIQADGFEDLRAAIALQGGDAHLGEGLQQAFVDGLADSCRRLFGRAVGRRRAGHVFDGFEGQVGVDGAGAIADQEREVHDLARLAGFDDEGDLGAGLFAYQVVVDGGERQQAGDGRVVRVDAAIGEDQQACSRIGWRARRARQSWVRARSRPLAPSSTGKSAGSVVARKSPCETRRSFSRSRLVRMGSLSLSVWQCCGVSARMLRSAPM